MSAPAAPATLNGRSHQDASAGQSTVKARLTPDRRKPAVENDEYGGFARRVLAAYARRVASGDLEALALMASLGTDVDTAIGEAVAGLRAFGYSWADIGARLGVTRQAAQQHWGGHLS